MNSSQSAEPASLWEAFARTAQAGPHALAAEDGTGRLTYAELEAAAARLAQRVAVCGAGPGDLVGVLVDRSVWSLVAILGVLGSGAAYVPLDPAYPAERLAFMVADAGVTVLVGEAEEARRCGLTGMRLVEVRDAAAAADDDLEPQLKAACRDDPAYVIYTSGSTGKPKGCIVTHGNVLALLEASLPLFDFSSADRWSVFHSHCFDFSVWEVWGAFSTGGTAVPVPIERARSAEEFLKFLEAQRISVLNQVPSAFRALALVHSEGTALLPSLRYVIFGGESIDLDVLKGFAEHAPRPAPTMVNMYGITEITVHATIRFLTEDDYRGGCSSPIGRPLPHLEIELRDDELAAVAPGTVGEMWVSGTAVAQGYLNRPELTAERFVTFDAPDGPRRAYRTGDLARVLPDGQLEYLGRNDQQVKVRGFRIELAEIEAALRAHRLVADAAVTAVRRPSSGQMLVACVVPAVPETGLKELTVELRRDLLGRLPRHMVPDRFGTVLALPATPSGKLDRQALAALASSF